MVDWKDGGDSDSIDMEALLRNLNKALKNFNKHVENGEKAFVNVEAQLVKMGTRFALLDNNMKKSMELKSKENRIRHGERIEQDEQQGAIVRRNKEFAHSLGQTTNTLNFVTQSLTKGRGIGATMGMFTSSIYNATQQVTKLNKLRADSAKDPTNKPLADALKEAEDEIKKNSWAASKHGSKIVNSLSKANSFFTKHHTGLMFGAGFAGLLVGVITKAMSVAPMFQAMLKLMKFAVTMILMPIGTFIGAIISPIVIGIIKSIAPQFGDWMKTSMSMGKKIGNWLVGGEWDNPLKKIWDAASIVNNQDALTNTGLVASAVTIPAVITAGAVLTNKIIKKGKNIWNTGNVNKLPIGQTKMTTYTNPNWTTQFKELLNKNTKGFANTLKSFIPTRTSLSMPRIGTGSTAFMVSQFLDIVPEFKAFRLEFGKWMRDSLGTHDFEWLDRIVYGNKIKNPSGGTNNIPMWGYASEEMAENAEHGAEMMENMEKALKVMGHEQAPAMEQSVRAMLTHYQSMQRLGNTQY